MEDISNDDDLDIFGESDDEHTEAEDEDASPNKNVNKFQNYLSARSIG